MKVENAMVTITMPMELLTLIQIAVGHLGMSIEDGSFKVGTKKQNEMVLDSLCSLHHQIENTLGQVA